MNKHLIVLCGFLYFYLIGVAWGNNVDSLLDRGDIFFGQGRYVESIDMYRQATQAAPKTPLPYLQLGRAYAANEQYEEAIAAFQRAIRLQLRGPLAVLAYRELGALYGKRGQTDQAIAALRQAIQLAPNDFKTFYELGIAYWGAERLREAFDAFTQAHQLTKAAAQQPEEVQQYAAQIEIDLNILRPLVAAAPSRSDEPAVQPRPTPSPKTYQLTVRATPADSRIMILNIVPKYQPGIALEPGPYHIQVDRPGYRRQRQWVTIDDRDVTLEIALQPETYALTVQATPPESHITLVDHPQAYRPGMALAPGHYEILVEHEGYASQRHAVTISDRAVQMQVDLKRLEYSLTVAARPEDSRIRILNIVPRYQPGMRLPPGKYEVEVSKPGYQPWQEWVELVNGDVVVPVDLAQTTYGLTVQVEPADSQIRLVNYSASYRPGMLLPPGQYEVVAEHEGYEPARRTVVIEDRAVTVEMALRLRTYGLTVQVEPADSVIAFRHAEMTYEAGMQVAPGEYELDVSKPGYVSQQPRVTVVDQDVTVAVTLARETYGLTVRTTPPNSQVTLVGYGQPYEPGMRLAPGTYEVLVEHEGYEPARQSVEIASEDVSIDVVLQLRTYALSVNATPADSTVRVLNIRERYQEGMRLRPGDYEIEVSRQGYFAHRQVVSVVDQDIDLSVVLTPEAYGLSVVTTPADSQVSVLGVGVEEAYRPGMLLPPGRYQVVVARQGYHSSRKRVRIRQSAVELKVELEQIVHPLTVSVTPRDSRVSVVDYPDAYRPGMLLPQGAYEVLVEHEGYASQRHAVTISDRAVQMQVDLKRLEYSLTVAAHPEDSRIRILNIVPRYQPGMRLPPGNYEVEVSKPGYQPWQEWVELVDGDVVVPVDLAQTTYGLTVQVEPADSQIRLVNYSASYRPGMLLPPGQYEVVAEHEGYEPARRTVVIEDRAVTVEMALRLRTYGLTVQVEPADSVIAFRHAEMTYEAGMQVAPGEYELDVSKPGYVSQQPRVTVVDQDVTVAVTLAREVYPLVVATTPDDSRIMLVDYAETYYPGMQLPPGSYEVEVERDGYESERRTVEIHDQPVHLTINLRRARYELTVAVTPKDSEITIVDYPEPYRPGLALLPGRYKVRVERDGYKPVRREVTISKRDLTVEISLEPAPLLATPPATDEAAQLEARIAEQAQRLKQARDQLSQAQQKIVDLKREVGKHERWAEDHQRKFTYFRDKLKRKQDQQLQDPSISLEPERTQYTEAFQTKKQNEEALMQLKEQVTAAELDLGVLETRVEDAHNELSALNQRLDQLRLQTLYSQIEQPATIVGRGEYRCRLHMTVAQCRQEALKEAQRDAKDKGMERLLQTMADFRGIPQARREALRQQVEPTILDSQTLKEGWANRTDYFYHIEAKVQGRVPAELRPSPPDSLAPGRPTAPDSPSEPQKTYTLTVRAMPQDSDVRLLELDTPYRHGMALAPGEYTLLVERAGYYSYDQKIEVRDADITLDVVLDRVEAPAPNGSVRRALVIGNASYEQAPLNNPLNDAEDMSTTLQDLGFKVDLLRDASRRDMDNHIRQFARHLRRGGVGLLYYAGHGVQVEGQNYLIPVDAHLETAADVKSRSVPLGEVLERLEKTGNDLNIVILDACRNNPFTRGWRGVYQRGLAEAQARGTIIAYATAPGQVARDGEGRNGIYTKHLLAEMRKPGLPIEQVFKQVRIGVQQETQNQQTPWENSSLLGDFYFIKGK